MERLWNTGTFVAAQEFLTGRRSDIELVLADPHSLPAMAHAKYARVLLVLATAAIATCVSNNPRDAKGRSPRAKVELRDGAPDPWNSTGIKGVQYNPSYSMNSIMTWFVAGSVSQPCLPPSPRCRQRRIDYDASLVATEIGYAASASANTIRVHLNWIPWFLNPTQFLANVESTIGAAAARGVRVILAVFDATGCCDPTPSWVKDGQYNTTGWVQNPGQAMVNNASSWTLLDSYVAALTTAYGRDPRVVGWDVLYQPQLATQQPSGGELWDGWQGGYRALQRCCLQAPSTSSSTSRRPCEEPWTPRSRSQPFRSFRADPLATPRRCP